MRTCASFIAAMAVFALWHAPAGRAAEPIDYREQIKPILESHCVKCHGAKEQQSSLRLDSVALALSGGSGGPAIVPGHSRQSRLIKAVLGERDMTRMPPEEEGDPLKPNDVELLKTWIDQGAPAPREPVPTRFAKHWSFQPIASPEVPRIKNAAWVRNAIDAFILSRLEQQGLTPSAEADNSTLLRRVYLDLIGLPPSPAEMDEFLSDTGRDAYERLVDRLLASPRYGERWGRHWLDQARYADSNGYTIDSERSIWKYRDWVIEALNRDLPFDRFTIEQLAGDLLPRATQDQIVATGFHRNTLINEEGGVDEEQFRIEAVVDRVNTTGAVWLGLTVGCAQCHSHKFDPISHKDYYQLFAFFNDADEPNLPAMTANEHARVAKLRREKNELEEQLKRYDLGSGAKQASWEAKYKQVPTVVWTKLDPVEFSSVGRATIVKLPDKSLLVGGNVPDKDIYSIAADTDLNVVTAVRIKILPHAALPAGGPGLGRNGEFYLNDALLAAIPLPLIPEMEPQIAPVTAAYADDAAMEHQPVRATDNNPKTGWKIDSASALEHRITLVPKKEIAAKQGSRLVLTLSQQQGNRHSLGRFQIWATSAPSEPIHDEYLQTLVSVPAEKRSAFQKYELERFFRMQDQDRKPLADRLDALVKEEQKLLEGASTMVMKERSQPRDSHVLFRGDFLRPGPEVRPDVPAVLPPLAVQGRRATRLDLARWLVDAQNPLTARVTINRFWQKYFGVGLVETENDFGIQGSPPTHPELLDWLSREFMARSWSMKAMHRLIVTSATYRQAAQVRREHIERDPTNKWLARQSRVRLEAEAIRDVALAASGLLSPKIGGPSVYPPQPAGVYRFTQSEKAWPVSTGPDRFRRGMYTFFWRSSPYPFLMTFDAPNANVTCTRRMRSNTPLQALTVANDPAFVEIAQGLAGRVFREAPAASDRRLRYLFKLCMTREPDAKEQARLAAYFKAELQDFEKNRADAKAVAPAVAIAGTSLPEAAAWTAVARVMLNVDEFITRN